MGVHSKAGLPIIGLIALRIAWGFLGSTYARFSTFVPTPARLLAYLRGQWHGVGHNPLGALSVLGASKPSFCMGCWATCWPSSSISA